ncbi:HWE histidine kinase domain-containing protein [Roseibium sp.]|uniref:HWE histidine kinase domain-containing protein n=1 Tax=Roseibium sp. TaxID=1936156 RepID=UPI003A984038
MPHRSTEELREEIFLLQEALTRTAEERDAKALAARKAEDRLNLLEAVMETVPVGVVLADQNGHIIHGNSHVQKMVRHPVRHSNDYDSYGEWVSFHECGRRVESHEYPLSRVIKDGKDRSELEVHYQRGDGSRFWMRIIGEPVFDPEGTRVGAAVALIDIDEERRLRETQETLIGELDHRVKNAFTVVKSIVSRSLKMSDQDELRTTIDNRLNAYARAHSKLVGTTWDRACLTEIARDVLLPIAADSIVISGPKYELASRQALAFSMAFYELATNATKYGALSCAQGRVLLNWNIAESVPDAWVEVSWVERDGPPAASPTRSGFGSFITGLALEMETRGKAESDYTRDGFEWRLRMPIEKGGHC